MIPGGLWLLADSRLPSGGHAHSGGVEAAAARGELGTPRDLAGFLAARVPTTGRVAAAVAAAAPTTAAATRERRPVPPGATGRRVGVAMMATGVVAALVALVAVLGTDPPAPSPSGSPTDHQVVAAPAEPPAILPPSPLDGSAAGALRSAMPPQLAPDDEQPSSAPAPAAVPDPQAFVPSEHDRSGGHDDGRGDDTEVGRHHRDRGGDHDDGSDRSDDGGHHGDGGDRSDDDHADDRAYGGHDHADSDERGDGGGRD